MDDRFRYFDAHTHIHFAAFENDWREAGRRALDNGIAFITTGTQKDTSERAVAAARELGAGAYAAVGLHPVHTDRSYHDASELGGGEAAKAFVSRGEVFDPDWYLALAREPEVVAIGECGLDYYRLEGSPEEQKEKKRKQEEAFVMQIEVAYQAGKPLVIHCRQAVRDLVPILEARRDKLRDEDPGLAHFYTDGLEDGKRLLDLGFSFSIGGVITFTRDYDGFLRLIPDARLLTETDAPYVSPAPHRGRRNEPMHIPIIVQKLADIRDTDESALARTIMGNARRIFAVERR